MSDFGLVVWVRILGGRRLVSDYCSGVTSSSPSAGITFWFSSASSCPSTGMSSQRIRIAGEKLIGIPWATQGDM